VQHFPKFFFARVNSRAQRKKLPKIVKKLKEKLLTQSCMKSVGYMGVFDLSKSSFY